VVVPVVVAVVVVVVLLLQRNRLFDQEVLGLVALVHLVLEEGCYSILEHHREVLGPVCLDKVVGYNLEWVVHGCQEEVLRIDLEVVGHNLVRLGKAKDHRKVHLAVLAVLDRARIHHDHADLHLELPGRLDLQVKQCLAVHHVALEVLERENLYVEQQQLIQHQQRRRLPHLQQEGLPRKVDNRLLGLLELLFEVRLDMGLGFQQLVELLGKEPGPENRFAERLGRELVHQQWLEQAVLDILLVKLVDMAVVFQRLVELLDTVVGFQQ
jgi:hypothetical protein